MSVLLGGLQLGPRSCPCSIPLGTRGTGKEDAAEMLVLPGSSQQCSGSTCAAVFVLTAAPLAPRSQSAFPRTWH